MKSRRVVSSVRIRTLPRVGRVGTVAGRGVLLFPGGGGGGETCFAQPGRPKSTRSASGAAARTPVDARGSVGKIREPASIREGGVLEARMPRFVIGTVAFAAFF